MNYNKETSFVDGYKIRLYPSEEQAKYINKCIDTNRYVYNWALNLENESCKNGNGFISQFTLMKMLTQHRKNTPWLQEIPNTTCRSGIIDLMMAYNMFFKKVSNKPKFKSKKKEEKHSFHTRVERVYFKDTKIKIEGCDYIETRMNLDEFSNIKIHNVVISRDNLNNYSITFGILKNKINLDVPKSEVIGIDLNKKNYFALSNGKIYKAPEEKIKRLQKGISDAQSRVAKDRERHNELEKNNPGKEIPISKRAEKRRTRYLKRCKKLTNVVENTIHNITKDIIKTNPAGVVMEDLDVNDMKRKNHFAAKEINNYSFGKCREIMKNKCNKYNIPFKLAPQNFPSSKMCNNCGYTHETWGHQNFICPNCGYKANRDINAAKNLADQFDKL